LAGTVRLPDLAATLTRLEVTPGLEDARCDSPQMRQPMSFLDLFAGFVLLVLIVSAVAILVTMAIAPGHIAHRRNHPWAEAVAVSGWLTVIFGLVLWPLSFIWAYVDVPQKKEAPR
jgi:uncharacterized BrkB/YihY/UPF0761 family membrane protein